MFCLFVVSFFSWFVGQLEEDKAEEEIPNDTPCCKCQKTHQPEWVITNLDSHLKHVKLISKTVFPDPNIYMYTVYRGMFINIVNQKVKFITCRF